MPHSSSTPMALQPHPRLKRSASTASLPTPPRTHHKRTRSTTSANQSPSSSSDENDNGNGGDDDDNDGRLVLGTKRRRTSLQKNGQEIEEEENEFWMGKKDTLLSLSRSPSTSLSPPTLSYRIAAPKAPVSPPPSRRQTITVPHTPRPVTPEPKTTTTTTDGPTRVRDVFDPIRDSPNNPFLVPSPHSPTPPLPAEPRTPSPAPDAPEKPTITYVFRGMKAEFANPLFNLSPSTQERARLPIDDPEYSPTAACPPKLLFPAAHRQLRRKPSPRTPSPRRHAARQRSSSPSGRGGERSLEMEIANAEKKRKSKKKKVESAKVRVDDPIRMAMGPVRR